MDVANIGGDTVASRLLDGAGVGGLVNPFQDAATGDSVVAGKKNIGGGRQETQGDLWWSKCLVRHGF